jgi:AGZA family xanthine/uracil permease-like MFS transporter
MGAIVLEGVAITVLVITGLREAVMTAIRLALKRAIGIGLFILFLGLYQGGFVKVPVSVGQTLTAPPATPLAIGDFTSLPIVIALIGLGLVVLLVSRGVRGAIFWGILLTTALAIVIHYATNRPVSTAPGKAVLPTSWAAWPDFSTIGKGLNFTIFAKLGALTAVLTIFSLMLSDFFDTMGTVVGIGGQAGWLDRGGRLPRLFPVLMADSIGAVVGGVFSSSSTTTYVESAGGVAEGGRTGLVSLVVGCLFLLALFFAPIAEIIPPEATAAALIVVGFYMCRSIREINFADFEEGFPALITLIGIPLTYSISDGIGAGFVSYGFIRIVTGHARQTHWALWVVVAAFVLYFARPWIKNTFGV